MAKVKEGDVVRLKSGGPRMTVTMVMSKKVVVCQWFEGTKLRGGHFHPDALDPAEGAADDDAAGTGVD
jgi:uncharacterized protein YodC (DUF2158 family)